MTKLGFKPRSCLLPKSRHLNIALDCSSRIYEESTCSLDHKEVEKHIAEGRRRSRRERNAKKEGVLFHVCSCGDTKMDKTKAKG